MSVPLKKLQSIFGSITGKRKSAPSPKDFLDREHRTKSLLHPIGQSAIPLNPSRVRVVVFKDDKGMKQPLFDSQVNCESEGEEQSSKSLCDMRSIEALEYSSSSASSVPPSLTNSSEWGGRSAKSRRAGFVKKPSTDSELLGEMMFGSMPMKTVGNSIKVHYIRSTDQLMLTKTFSPVRKLLHQCSLTDYSDSCPLPGDVSSQTVERAYVPVPKNHSMLSSFRRSVSPDSGHKIRSSSLSIPSMRPGSALSTHSSPLTHSPPSPLQSMTGSVSSSLTRRIQRYRATSLENATELYRKVLQPLDKPPKSKKKYGIGVILSLSELSEPDIQHFQSFLFSHFTLIDAHLEKLKEVVFETSPNRGQAFINSMMQAYKNFLDDFLSLYKAPRIECPVWLSLVGQVDTRKEICNKFMEEFKYCISEMESKETKFFLSSLLTAVLSHHLAWVFTVSRNSSDSRFNKMIPKSLGVLAESHPYSPLWAQLGDLFGAVSFPLKLTRTIVTGKNRTNVCKLLYILTYFIRCSEVEPWRLTENRKRSQKIPVPEHQTSHDLHTCKSNDSSHDLLSLRRRLDDDLTMESRSSSITVIADHESHSLKTPYASPINLGRETSVIKPHPFSIQHTCTSRHPSFNSDSDFAGSGENSSRFPFGVNRTKSPSSSLRSPEKSGSISSYASDTPDSRRSSLKHRRPSNCTKSPTAFDTTLTCEGPSAESQTRSSHHPTHLPTCSTESCETMGVCPIPDGYVRFNPNTDYRLREVFPNLKNSPQNMYLLAHGQLLTNCSKLSQEFKLCKNNSTTSMDSGYDPSLTATEYSKESMCSTTSVCGDNLRDSCDSVDMTPFSSKQYPWSKVCIESNVQNRPYSDCLPPHFVGRSPPNSCYTNKPKHSVDNIVSAFPPEVSDPMQSVSPMMLFQDNDNSTCVSQKRDWPNHEQKHDTHRIPLVHVQQATMAEDDSCLDMRGVTHYSLRRQSALSESDSNEYSQEIPCDFSSTQDTFGSPTQSLPLHMMSSGAENHSGSVPTQSPSPLDMLNGWVTKSGPTDNSQEDSESFCETSGIFCSDDACSSIEASEKDYGPQRNLSIGDDMMNVEESFSANTLRAFRQNPSLLQQKLQAHDKVLCGDDQPLTPEQFSDFEDIALPSVHDFSLDLPQEAMYDTPRYNLDDFGHSLMVGLSPTYLSDFVLHGTDQQADDNVQNKIIKDLRSTVKYSVIDEPIEHGVAIVADTDSWTVKILSTSKSLQTSDVIVGSAVMQSSSYIRKLLRTVKSMCDLKLPADFCLSHVEDQLLELNERSIALANTLLEYGSDADSGDILQESLNSLSVQDHYDQLLLVALAGVNCPDRDIKAKLDNIFIINLFGKQYF